MILSDAVRKTIESGDSLNLQLGCGKRNRPGYFNLDIVPLDNVDIVADLNQPLCAFPDNSVRQIYSHQVFEHVANLMGLMEELYRVCAPGATLEISVPHFSNQYGYSDPTHVRLFGLYSMCYFVQESSQPFRRKVPDFYTHARFRLEHVHVSFYQMGQTKRNFADRLLRNNFEKRVVNRSCASLERYEKWMYRFWPAESIEYVLTVDK
ncbi:ubiquinone/menaquinone biosynthesis C-methylase UbiE [Desulfobaculum xiamenense]|uniref:Ubiquinone/menaquinone biosynthesis C-methylase UbiE n=1 Tax=Desulfobaculum xiamenense TaxID=995050 RepID=A0A846QRT1_9BACT|nr:methyltransferase domain-containing protein [Desulfobaculum xiamenense]NJB69073.1 ubiquinone/menaquinone biosynthesis C-methylase UbiE [Desulfobaculum xiamenense]